LAVLAIASILGGISVALAAGPPYALHSTNFNHQYNGDLYAVPNYTENSPIVSPSTDGDIFTYRAPTGGGYYQSTDWSVSSATGFTVEFRIKIDDDFPEGSKGSFLLLFGDGNAGDGFSIGKSSVWAGVGAVQVDSNVNTDDYHVFRIAQKEDGNGPANPTIDFWRDEVLINTWANGGNFAANLMTWGSAGGAYGGPTVHLDYIRWDNTGAFNVPEPSSLIMLGFAAMFAWRRQANRRG
jgi:hypothetical protein